MLVPVLLFIIGLLFLIKGGDWFVDGASALARRFHLPELLIGATVVSIGTTLPEVMVSTMSAVSGHGEIAYGNAIGSVICNSALIAAITIAVRPGKVDPKTLRVPVAFFFAAAAIYCVAAYAMGEFTRPLGFVMLAMFVAYMVANVLQMKKAPAAAEAEAEAENAGEEMSLTKTLVLLVLGAVLIALGANLLVDTEPDKAAYFIEQTKAASLAVAIGTAHGVYTSVPRLDLKRLEEIKAAVDVPLVLHGASGLSDGSIKESIKRGICKVNFATELRIAYSDGIKNALKQGPDVFDPKKYNEEGRRRVQDLVLNRMEVLGCLGKA